MLNVQQLRAVSEDLEYFRKWWSESTGVDTSEIRRASAILRRLLVEDVVGAAWRQIGFSKSPVLHGPDLLASLEERGIPMRQVLSAAAAGVRVKSKNIALISVHQRYPPIGVPLAEGEPFQYQIGYAWAMATKTPSSDFKGLDRIVYRSWRTPAYLAAPGLIRHGKVLSRREVIKHLANEMGGVHVNKNTASAYRKLLASIESQIFIGDEPSLALSTFYIEVLAIGQALGRSDDLSRLATRLRNETPVESVKGEYV